MATETPTRIGWIRDEGRRLLERWWQEMTAADEAQRPTAYVFVMGSLGEILRVFDLPVNCPEITSLQTAVRGQQLTGRQHPNGKVPKPALVVATNMCNTYIKWAEIWEQMYHCPIFVLDLPAWRGTDPSVSGGSQSCPGIESEAFQNDRRYVEGQLRDLIAICERLTGKPFDIDRLNFLSVFVIPPICDAARHACAVWARNLPHVNCQVLYLPQNAASRHAAAYLRGEYRRLAAVIEQTTGRPATDDAMRRSIVLFNENRRLLREL